MFHYAQCVCVVAVVADVAHVAGVSIILSLLPFASFVDEESGHVDALF